MNKLESLACTDCLKPTQLCVCDSIRPVSTKLKVVILQHPQEQVEPLSTARLTQQLLPEALLCTGLSWPSLKAVLRSNEAQLDHSKWGVLYLGTKNSSRPTSKDIAQASEITILDRKGKPMPEVALRELEGLVALDGSWRQAKTLWWRNPWLLKLKRVLLFPKTPSLYGKLRKEPRPESLSTLEAVALVVSTFHESSKIRDQMLSPFQLLLEKYRCLKTASRSE